MNLWMTLKRGPKPSSTASTAAVIWRRLRHCRNATFWFQHLGQWLVMFNLVWCIVAWVWGGVQDGIIIVKMNFKKRGMSDVVKTDDTTKPISPSRRHSKCFLTHCLHSAAGAVKQLTNHRVFFIYLTFVLFLHRNRWNTRDVITFSVYHVLNQGFMNRNLHRPLLIC